MRDCYAPLVWQCRYGGVEVPDRLWTYREFGRGKKYSDNQAEHMVRDEAVLVDFDRWVNEFATFAGAKGKVPPGRYRAYGRETPGHLLQDAKLLWRDIRMRAGVPLRDSSPARQQELGLNEDQTWSPRESEGEKIRRR
jgi:hypothetical protein